MARKKRVRQKVTRRKVSSSARSRSTSVNVSISRLGRANKSRSRATSVPLSKLPERSAEARTKALHVKAAMVRDPNLRLYPTARSFGVKPAVVKKYLGSALTKVGGHFRARKSDRFHEIMYVPDASGRSAPVLTKSAKERAQVSAFLRDIGRFYRGDTAALANWHGKRIAGVGLVTASRTLKSIDAQVADFAIYTTFNGAE